MNVKRWLNDWSAEMCFLSLFALAVLIFGFVIWQSEKYKNGGFVKEVRIDADVELGLIDSGYIGEVKAIVKTFEIGNYLAENIIIPAGTRIAQMRIVEIPNTELVSGVIKIQENDDKKRGDNGFNSTGVK